MKPTIVIENAQVAGIQRDPLGPTLTLMVEFMPTDLEADSLQWLMSLENEEEVHIGVEKCDTETPKDPADNAAREIGQTLAPFFSGEQWYRDTLPIIAKHILPLTTENAELKVEVEKLRKALEFYADLENYDEVGIVGNLVGVGPTTDKFEADIGNIARTALASEVAGEGEK